MPLDMRPAKGRNEFFACDIPRCTNRTWRRVYFMGHDMGRVCQRHAKEWDATWNECVTEPDA